MAIQHLFTMSPHFRAALYIGPRLELFFVLGKS